MHANEVEDRAERLVVGLAETAAELLEKQRGALGRTQHQDGVDRRDVDAFVEQVDGEDDRHLPVAEIAQRPVALVVGCLSPDRGCGDASRLNSSVMNRAWATLTQKPSARMLDRSPTRSPKLLDDLADPDVVGGVDVGEGGDVVAGAPSEGHLPQVETVVDPVVGERHQVLLVDRVPHP